MLPAEEILKLPRTAKQLPPPRQQFDILAEASEIIESHTESEAETNEYDPDDFIKELSEFIAEALAGLDDDEFHFTYKDILAFLWYGWYTAKIPLKTIGVTKQYLDFVIEELC